jgi:hypothetical protein
VPDEDIYATVKRPRGVGWRNELKSDHVIQALGISRKEWGEILVLSKSRISDALSDWRRLTSGSSTRRPGSSPHRVVNPYHGRERVLRREGVRWHCCVGGTPY